MSGSMSRLRLTRSSLGQCARILARKRSLAHTTWTLAITAAGRIPPPSVQAALMLARPLSTRRSARSGAEASRFRRAGAPLTETPASEPNQSSASQSSEHESGLDSATVSGSVPAPSPASTPRHAVAADIPPAAPAPRPVVPPMSSRPVARPQPMPQKRKPVDTSSKEYKQAARKWTSLFVALPFLIVTSYMLYQRLSKQLSELSSGGAKPADSAQQRPPEQQS